MIKNETLMRSTAITANGSRLGEVVDFGKLSFKFITNVK